jgi:RHH-type rel operon transcriptional repressor/antitoxin RelB
MALSIRLPKDIEERLDQLAVKTGRSKTYYVTQAIRDQLDDLEDIYLAEEELEAIRAGRSTTAPLAAVTVRHGLVD